MKAVPSQSICWAPVPPNAHTDLLGRGVQRPATGSLFLLLFGLRQLDLPITEVTLAFLGDARLPRSVTTTNPAFWHRISPPSLKTLGEGYLRASGDAVAGATKSHPFDRVDQD